MGENKEERFLKTIKAIATGSNTISTWSLSVIGGSLLSILSTSYIRPDCIYLKLFYLLFILGWIFIAISIYHGINISGRSMAADFYADDNKMLEDIFSKSNIDYKNQLGYFKKALFIFGIWLILYLLWWIFFYIAKK